MACTHERVRCLNHYAMFRKYLCDTCGEVFICECERSLALQFLPHQVRWGDEYGTRGRFPVSGFAPGLCAECRGQPEDPHPRAAIWGVKGKTERFYWREISKTLYGLARVWLAEHGKTTKDITEFHKVYPSVYRELHRDAKQFWIREHRRSPKYNMWEPTEPNFLSQVSIPVREVEAQYVQVKRGVERVGKWRSENGSLVRAEGIATEWYEKEGFVVLPCERRFVSVWVGTFLGEVIQDQADPRVRRVFRRSTRGWSTRAKNTPLIELFLPEDFGSSQYYARRRGAFEAAARLMSEAPGILQLFDELCDGTVLVRDYLWVNDDEVVHSARRALTILPRETVVASVAWAIGDFWRRQPGWPDLFAFKPGQYRFVEVKSPNDELSQEQMNWLKWAYDEAKIPCEICRVRKRHD